LKLIDLTIEINGNTYFTIKDFATVTKRSQQNVRFLISKGNRIRKLKVSHFADKPYVPYTELFEFPFTTAGRNSKRIYHYKENGSSQEEKTDERSTVQV